MNTCADPSLAPSQHALHSTSHHIARRRVEQILRAQPANIYEFGARYFAELVEENASALEAAQRAEMMGDVGEGGGLFDLNNDELQDFIMDMFLRYDTDESGYLDRKEFKQLMQSAELGLSKKEVRRIMSEADENDDGVLEYREFVPVMVEIVHGLKAKEAASREAAREEDEAREAVEMHLLHGMPREELEAMMAGVFNAADADGSGVLDRKEFAKCLKASELGLTRKEINVLLSEVDADGDGNISYAEFMPLCFNILVDRFKDDVLAESALQNPDALTQMLLEEFEAKERSAMGPESDGVVTGKVPMSFVKSALTVLSDEMLGLSKLQISSILSEAKMGEKKMVDYMIFAPSAARMIYSMVDLSSQALRVDAIAKISESEGAQLLHSLNGDTIKHVLKMAFEEADKDGNGTLDMGEIADVLQALGAGELALKPGEINALIAAVDEDQDGKVTYAELVDFLFDVLTHLERENYIQEVAFSAELDKLEAEAEAEEQ